MKFTLFCLSLLLFCFACFEPRNPLVENTGRSEIETALLELIQFHQRKNVRESCGEMAHQCFTSLDLGQFEASKKSEKIAAELTENPRFVSIAREIAQHPAEFWNALRQKALVVCRPTWSQMGKIDCAGQTDAGQYAEREIAAAIVGQLEIMLKNQLSDATPVAANLQTAPQDSSFFKKLKNIRWICYAPTHFNPNAGLMPADSSVEEDLNLLKKVGFSGLVTYGCDGVLGKNLPAIAQKCGFEGLILGLWSPENSDELQNAYAAARLPILTAFCVGNEGLGVRYDLETLAAAVDSLRRNTGKPVTTTEQVEDYADPDLLHLGDWVFPNVHPYWHQIHTPAAAAKWTAEQSNSLAARRKGFVLLKEVGFPSAGDDGNHMSEQLQDEYYRLLEKSGTPFCYFEAFDGPWKNWEPVEPFWGLFRADRSPKLVVRNLPKY